MVNIMKTTIKNGGVTLHVIDNTKKFFSIFNFNERKSLNKVGEFCKGNMDRYVRVDTGRLKSNNKYKVTLFNQLFLYNNTPYALYQEYGKRGPYTWTPFIRPSVYNHIREIENIWGKSLGDNL